MFLDKERRLIADCRKCRQLGNAVSGYKIRMRLRKIVAA
jgi:hypothetical protein